MSKQEYENIYEQYKKMFVKEEKDMSRYKCPCGWIYDPKEHGGKPFSEWPGPCPESGTAKSKFKKMDMSEMMSLPPSKVEKLDSKKVVVNFFATVENICKYIAEGIIKSKLPGDIKNVRVKVYETAEDYAEFSLATN